MKTLIAYGSKHGRTEMWAHKLAECIEGQVDVVDLKKSRDLDIDEYDRVILGSAVYAGRIRKEVLRFVDKYLDKLLYKKVGLFICCMSYDNTVDSLEVTFPQVLIEGAVVKSTFAGEFNLKRLNLFEKLIVKLVEANNELKPIKTDIEGFVAAINKA